MTLKKTIVAELGAPEILTPDRIADALVANDQAKYYFALLLSARANTDHPSVPPIDLKAERVASQLGDDWLDDVVGGTRKDGTGAYRIPHGPEILRRIATAVREMLDCLPDGQRTPFLSRLGKLEVTAAEHGAIPGDQISRIVSGDREAGDSLHLLVMDIHRAINRFQIEIAVETLAGASVHGLSSQGRSLVEAFMEGLNRTAPLKFDHPGLGTTATEHGGRVLIQNDIGTTDAHVLVVRVDDLSVSINYSDVHSSRLKFFKSLFESFDVAWEGVTERESVSITSESYILTTGSFRAKDENALREFLVHLGSRIVFLIDWNRMRKRLREFVGKREAVAVLKWAADHDIGHRGLLEVGGEDALARAIEFAAGARLRYGQRLDDLIRGDRATEFLKEAMELASVGLRQRRSRRNIQDELKVRLTRFFEHERLGIFDVAAEHAAIGYDLAYGLVETLARVGDPQGRDWTARFAVRAIDWESRADRLLNEARDDIRRFSRPSSLLGFFEFADDAVDELEEAAAVADLAQLFPTTAATAGRLRELAELPLMSAQELVTCIECAATVTRSDVRDDLDEFMAALERLVAIEHRADETLRTLRRWLLLQTLGERHITVLREFCQALEATTDAHAHAGLALRNYLMEEVIT